MQENAELVSPDYGLSLWTIAMLVVLVLLAFFLYRGIRKNLRKRNRE
jgi:cbb3-type cytochrome oxidase subunit 3